MAHATSGTRSYASDDKTTVPTKTASKQAATRAAYIAAILADWPPLTPQQKNTIGSLLGGAA